MNDDVISRFLLAGDLDTLDNSVSVCTTWHRIMNSRDFLLAIYTIYFLPYFTDYTDHVHARDHIFKNYGWFSRKSKEYCLRHMIDCSGDEDSSVRSFVRLGLRDHLACALSIPSSNRAHCIAFEEVIKYGRIDLLDIITERYDFVSLYTIVKVVDMFHSGDINTKGLEHPIADIAIVYDNVSVFSAVVGEYRDVDLQEVMDISVELGAIRMVEYLFTLGIRTVDMAAKAGALEQTEVLTFLYRQEPQLLYPALLAACDHGRSDTVRYILSYSISYTRQQYTHIVERAMDSGDLSTVKYVKVAFPESWFKPERLLERVNKDHSHYVIEYIVGRIERDRVSRLLKKPVFLQHYVVVRLLVVRLPTNKHKKLAKRHDVAPEQLDLLTWRIMAKKKCLYTHRSLDR